MKAAVVLIAIAQAATEVFIPIGRSPGLTTAVGIVGSTDPLTVSGRAFGTDRKTDVFIDRSARGEVNSKGSLADVRVGDRVEVATCVPRYGRGRACREVADWVKKEEAE